MKALLICGSLLVNAVLVAALVERPTLAPPALRHLFPHGPAKAASVTSAAKPEKPTSQEKLWSRIDTTDLQTLVTRLRAAGFPPNVVRSIIAALIDAQYSPQIRALTAQDPSTPFWKLKPQFGSANEKRFVEMQRVRREVSQLERDLAADLPPDDSDISSYQRARFGNLSPAKIQALQRIEDDYSEMTSAIRASMNGIELPEDREKLALLAKEKRADLAAILSPDELTDYQMRSSILTTVLRNQLTALDASEPEYRAIFQAYQQLGQKFTTPTELNFNPQAREQAQQSLAATLKTALGDARYNDFLLTSSMDYQQLTRIAQQQNLPGDAAAQAMALRASVAQQSQQIAADTATSIEERRSALQTLAANARLQLGNLLPGDAGQAYAKRASWLTALDHGMGVSFTPAPPLIIMTDSGSTTSFGGSEMRAVPLKRGPH